MVATEYMIAQVRCRKRVYRRVSSCEIPGGAGVPAGQMTGAEAGPTHEAPVFWICCTRVFSISALSAHSAVNPIRPLNVLRWDVFNRRQGCDRQY
jgi:hypothetical protein